MTQRERELIVGALRIRRDLVAMMMKNEAPCYKVRPDLDALWQELKTLADRIDSGNWQAKETETVDYTCTICNASFPGGVFNGCQRLRGPKCDAPSLTENKS